jgi:hypothetical protein
MHLVEKKKELSSTDTSPTEDDYINTSTAEEGLEDEGVGSSPCAHAPFLPSEYHSRTEAQLLMAHSVEQQVHVELLHLLEKAEAPDYLFNDIIHWASRAREKNYSFTPRMSNRNAVINDLEKHFGMEHLRPRIQHIKLESIKETVPLATFNFKHQLMSLLTDAGIMQPENLVVNAPIECLDGTIDYSPCFEPYQAPDGMLDEVLSGSWYKDTIASMDTDNCFVCPLIFYIDKTFIDPTRGRFNLEPLNFTLAIFNRSCRAKFQYWKTLGYVPAVPDSDERNPAAGYKARNYHTLLKLLLGEVQEIHDNPSILDNIVICIGDLRRRVNVRIPIAFFVADTQGADKLCGRFVVYSDKVKRLHRTCLVAPCDATLTTEDCTWVEMDEMMEIIDEGDKEMLDSLSQQRIPEHAFRNMDFGANPHGIYGATPNDNLHGIKLGIMLHLFHLFIDDLTPLVCLELNNALKATLPYMKQGANHQYPRLYFPNGITSLKNVTAEEVVGLLFVTYLLCLTNQGRSAIGVGSKLSTGKLKLYLEAFEMLLIFNKWLSKSDGYWKLGDRRAKNKAAKSIKKIIQFITSNFERETAQNWNISKMHELMHLPKYIDMFGGPGGYDTASSEKMHIDIAKKPGRRSQKRHASFIVQSANRLVDRQILDLAYSIFLGKEEETKKTKNKAEGPEAGGSKYVLKVTVDNNGLHPKYEVKIHGYGSLFYVDLPNLIYPRLVEFIVSFFSHHEAPMPTNITCLSEYTDDERNIYRAHPSYRSNGSWNDWVWVSYMKDGREEEYASVPAKILCFLPHGIPGDDSIHAVVHPCQWQKKTVSRLVNKWKLLPDSKASYNGIPYDIVPVSSFDGHCLVIPDLVRRDGITLPNISGEVYQLHSIEKWIDEF